MMRGWLKRIVKYLLIWKYNHNRKTRKFCAVGDSNKFSRAFVNSEYFTTVLQQYRLRDSGKQLLPTATGKIKEWLECGGVQQTNSNRPSCGTTSSDWSRGCESGRRLWRNGALALVCADVLVEDSLLPEVFPALRALIGLLTGMDS